MTRPVVLVVNCPRRAADALEADFEVHSADDLDSALAARGADAEYALFQGHDGFTGERMDRAPKLRVISNYGVGYDAIDVDAAAKRGIMVTHTPDVLNDETANTAVMLMLAVARNFLADADHLRQGRWATEGSPPMSRSVRGLRAGILGLGRIGKTLADKLEAFGLEICYHGRTNQGLSYEYFPDLAAMAEASDILFVVAPGGAGTRRLVDARVMEALGPRGILVNIGRGSVVDEQALIAALRDGRLGAAGLDVFENEPHVPEELIALPNATLLPHVGSATAETRDAMCDLAVENLVSFARTGRPVTPVPECRDI